MRSKTVALTIYLGAVIIGMVVGVAVDRRLVRPWQAARAQNQQAMQNRFASELNLTPEQKAASDSLFGRAGSARRADSLIWAPFRPQMIELRRQSDSVFTAARAEFRSRLTPEQQEIWDKRQARRNRSNNDNRR